MFNRTSVQKLLFYPPLYDMLFICGMVLLAKSIGKALKKFVHTDVSCCAKLKNFRIITSWMMTTNSSNTSIFSSNIHLLRYISVISFLATKYEDGYIFETTGYRKNYFLIGSVYQIASSIGQSCFYQPADGEKTEEKWSWRTNKFWRRNPSKGCKGSRAEKGEFLKIFILVA